MKYLLATVTILLSLAMVNLPAQAQRQYQDPYPNGYYGQQQGRLSPQDQQQFDKYYSKWVDAQRKNDQDDVRGNAQHMQEIMQRNNIPPNVPFQEIASGGAYSNAYPNGNYQGAYPQGRLSPEDQRKFDSYYSKWVDAQSKNDQDDIRSNAQHMQDIMVRNNIAPNTPFQAVASNGGYGNSAYGNGGYGNGGYGANAQPYGQAGRLSPSDQHEFDKDYKNWVKARHKKDMDDVDSNARKMEQIMARNNIPANVPFERIASPDALSH